MTDKRQDEIDAANSAFWDELCGTLLAKQLGVSDASPDSLKKFDDWYMKFYHYLDKHIPFSNFAGKSILEVGLGYGTVSQRIVESGAVYSGLDIAAGPVDMVNKRIALAGGKGEAVRGSVLQAPFPDEHFNYVVAIGSLHHTGALERAIREVHRLLKPNGQAIIMVYNAASYRQWAAAPLDTLKRVMQSANRYRGGNEVNERMRRAYDADSTGSGAPQTEFVTKSELEYLCRSFSSRRIVAENIGAEFWLRYLNRKFACRVLGPFLGLDLYCSLRK